MSSVELATWLREAGAHHDVVSWATTFGADWDRALRTCPRGDWLLAIAWRLGAPPEQVVRAALGCASVAASYGAEDDPHGRSALEAVGAFLRGEVSAEVSASAGRRAEEVADVSPDGSVAASLRAAAAAAHAPADLSRAPLAAALAVEAAVLDAGDCAMTQVLGYMHDRCADAVRHALDLTALGPPSEAAAQGR